MYFTELTKVTLLVTVCFPEKFNIGSYTTKTWLLDKKNEAIRILVMKQYLITEMQVNSGWENVVCVQTWIWTLISEL